MADKLCKKNKPSVSPLCSRSYIYNGTFLSDLFQVCVLSWPNEEAPPCVLYVLKLSLSLFRHLIRALYPEVGFKRAHVPDMRAFVNFIISFRLLQYGYLMLVPQPERGCTRGYIDRDDTNDTNTIANRLGTPWLSFDLDDYLRAASSTPGKDEDS